MSKRVTFKLSVIPKPEENTRSVFQWGKNASPKTRMGPMIKGGGISDYVCGDCGHIILEGPNLNQVQNIVFKCEKCGKYNELVLY